ncbi:patatin-like phospholipase family protein [Parvularcula dongshanensis]|uniref:NTE family protein n=1 Tax=Parvularcula dongshanensis TaxID=1173995 RepID=A0A840I1I2_9PROT|nr:patatin-like phospholipase family protein [Parvularcula dongshanensis]MBB4658679.1 NTE family protein [Parvularcula dongshanensis]
MRKRSEGRPVIGVALGSGAARGWAHVGVLEALDELGVEVTVQAGCSVGALVSAARHLGIWEEFQRWAVGIGSFASWSSFAYGFGRGGLVDPGPAFEAFREHDRLIEDLDRPWGAVATDLATGQEVWLTRGSVLDACRASAAVPMLLHAAQHQVGDKVRWLIDGAATNPVPVSLARALGADRVISVDLNTTGRVLERFDRPTGRAVVPVEMPHIPGETIMPRSVADFLKGTKNTIDRELAMMKAKSAAQPHFLETVVATLDIVQAQLSEARAQIEVADVRITPDMADCPPGAFDRFEDYRGIGYEATMALSDEIEALVSPDGADSAGAADRGRL